VAITEELRLAEVLGALTYALDLGEGQAAGHALRTCLIGMAVGERCDLDAEQRSALYYALMLKDVGCSSNASRTAALLAADDQDAKRAHKLTDWTRRPERFRWAARVVGRYDTPAGRARRLAMLARGKDINREFTRLRCERGAEIAEGLGFPPATSAAIYSLDEHWDGSGHPHGLTGEGIPLLARIACLAQTAEVFAAVRGARPAITMARRRRGRWFDPVLVDMLDEPVLRDLPTDHGDLTRATAAHEPPDRVLFADEAQVSRIAHAFAEVIDAKSPSTGGHSHRVAALARAAGERLGLAPDAGLVRAALLHDIGKLAVSSRILDKPGPLTAREWMAVRLHPTHTETLLGLVGPLRPIAATAAMHHERLDGSGYPRGLRGDELSAEARLLAVADVFEALTSPRPYRAAMPSDAAVGVLRDEARAGKLDGEVVEALVAFLDDPGREEGAPTVR
jgi:HD-GYP domain-containing protein (c-di-GMP phosphodiesterase class II)